MTLEIFSNQKCHWTFYKFNFKYVGFEQKNV